jgi:hypothetical protein
MGMVMGFALATITYDLALPTSCSVHVDNRVRDGTSERAVISASEEVVQSRGSTTHTASKDAPATSIGNVFKDPWEKVEQAKAFTSIVSTMLHMATMFRRG